MRDKMPFADIVIVLVGQRNIHAFSDMTVIYNYTDMLRWALDMGFMV